MAKKIKLKLSPRLLKKRTRRGSYSGKRHCRFTENPELVAQIDYKNTAFLKSFLTERGKILAARISGTSAHYQRLLSCEIKKARIIGLLPFTGV